MQNKSIPNRPQKKRIAAAIYSAAIASTLGYNSQTLADCTPGNIGTAGPDIITCDIDNDAAGADVEALGGNDTLYLNGGTTGNVDGGDGDDTFELDDVVISGSLIGGSGNDTIKINNRDTKIGEYFSGGLDAGDGNDTIEFYDGLAFYLLGGDGDDYILLDGGYVFNQLDAGDGDDTIYWDEGLAGSVLGGNGSDFLVIDSFAYDSDVLLDGGDDLSASDGYVDTLKFILDHEIDGNLLQNWERIFINGSSKIIFGGELSVGGGQDANGDDLGLVIVYGGHVEFRPQKFQLTGSIANAGTINLQNGRFDKLTVSSDSSGNFGDYTGHNGRMWFDALLNGDDSPADLVQVLGNVSGRTTIRVRNARGIGATTMGDGIEIISIAGNSPGDAFVLDGDYVAHDGQPAVVSGAYAYTLQHNGITDPDDGNWYLRSDVADPDSPADMITRWQPGAVLYETYPQLIRAMNRTGTLRQRVGNRFWVGSSYLDVNKCDYIGSVEQTIDGGGAWIRLAGNYSNMDPEISTTRAEWRQNYWEIQFGNDFAVYPEVYDGQMIFSVMGKFGYANTDVSSFFGDGEIDSRSYGVGTALTWYSARGSYADLQGHFNWFTSEIDSPDLRQLVDHHDALGFSLSFEAGHSFKLCDYYALTPQAQISYTSEDIDELFDEYGVHLEDARNDGFSARFGLAFENRISQRKSNANMYGNLLLERINFYAIANAIYNFSDPTDVTVSQTRLIQEEDDWKGQLGLGATYDQCGDYCSVYGEIDYSTSLTNPGDSYGASLTFGFRFKW